MSAYNIIQLICAYSIPILFAITIHEAAHGYVAHYYGDDTAKMMGRLSLNPLKHIDLIGTILVPVAIFLLTQFRFLFGWAKPVPVVEKNLKNPRRHMPLVALAGPVVNVIMALFWAVIAKLALIFLSSFKSTQAFFVLAGQAGIFINVILAILNLLPIPPLDGSRVITIFMPDKMADKFRTLDPYGFIILILLLLSGILGLIILPLYSLIVNIILYVFGI